MLETTDLVFAVDSIPAVFGVTRDPFLVYTSNVCAILGLRAFYFLLAGILPYFRYLDEGLAIVLMFIGAKMLAEPWVHISTEISLAIVGGVIAIAVLISVVAAKSRPRDRATLQRPWTADRVSILRQTPEYIHRLADPDPDQRAQVARGIFSATGADGLLNWFDNVEKDADFRALIVQEQVARPHGGQAFCPMQIDGRNCRPAGNFRENSRSQWFSASRRGPLRSGRAGV